MISPTAAPRLDARTASDIARDVLVRRWGYVPEWLGTFTEPDPDALPRTADAALVWILARFAETILRRLDQAPEKNKLAFLASLGIELIPPQPSRAPVVFTMAANGADLSLPAGTRLMAPPPPESSDQVAFETERAAGLNGARLTEVVSLWPGRDQYIDHSAAAAGKDARPFRPFDLADLRDTPHHLYLSHERLLKLAGQAIVEVEFELVRGSDEPLDINWEYWDGKVWRGFSSARPMCGEDERLDGTRGLTHSGVVRVETACAETATNTIAGIESFWIRGRLQERLLPGSPSYPPEVSGIRLSTRVERTLTFPAGGSGSVSGGLLPDSALADGLTLDVSEPFYPFGQQAGPGSTFYFAADEAFGRVGAEVTVAIESTATPTDSLRVTAPASGSGDATSVGTPLEHTVSWEFWDGLEWRALAVSATVADSTNGNDTPADFTGSGTIAFTVPSAIRSTEVEGEEAYWIRVRVLSGGFGFTQQVTWQDTSSGTNRSNTFTYVIPQPPALSQIRIGYTWQDGPYDPEGVIAYNDFRYENRTEDARWEGASFTPYRALSDIPPALYLGFDSRLPVDRLNFFFDIEEDPGELSRPELVWEYWKGSAWSRLSTEDGTNRLAAAGMVSLIGPADSRAYARFGEPRHWIRARLKEDGPPRSPTIRRVYNNAVWAVQRETVVNDPLGTSDGSGDQVFVFPRVPVLAGEQVEVRELRGPRAAVEWRIVASELFGADDRRVRDVEERVSAESPGLEVEEGPLRLRLDRERLVTEVWVTWSGQPHLYDSGPGDRVYVLERARGRLKFGDGRRGRVPPEGAIIQARRYRTGGGRRGNVAADSITQAAAGIGGAEAITNPLAAQGGADVESPARVGTRGPRTVRHRGRAISASDLETMAREASATVAVARVIPTRDPSGRKRPGWVTVLIIPESGELRPWPSYQLRRQVQESIANRAAGDIAAAQRVHVTGPVYQPVDVRAEIVAERPEQAGTVEARAREAIETFLHPLRGGPDRTGWDPGLDVYLSDLAAVLERVDGVDHVRELSLLSEGIARGERLRIPEGRFVTAGSLEIIMRA